MFPIVFLFAALALFLPAKPATAQSGFPKVSGQKLATGLYKADCNPRTMLSRSSPVQKHGEFYAYPLRLCVDGTLPERLVFWTRPGPSKRSQSIAVATPRGRGIQIARSEFDPASGARLYWIRPTHLGKGLECALVKPSGGLAPYGEVYCK